jgi:hypothetical protein
MSIPSITIRLDFGEGISSGVSRGISLQGEAPTPMDFRSDLAGVTQADLPTPFASITAATTQDVAPTPMSGIEGESAAMMTPPVPSLDIASAAMMTPPVPSLDIASASASGMPEDMPRPEGEPEASRKSPRRR